jgi:hypothetical protein
MPQGIPAFFMAVICERSVIAMPVASRENDTVG